MSPPYIFQIDEIGEYPDAIFHTDGHGNWKPSTDRNANYTITKGVTGRHWFCNSQQINEIQQRPQNAQHYKTFSLYYVGGVGFYVLKGDARNPPDDDVFHKLQFAYHNNQDYSSYLTDAGQHPTLRLQPQDQRWAHLVLPNIYHSHQIAPSQQYGGLVGELPIFLGLMAFTTSRDHLPGVLPHTFTGGSWVISHQWQMQRIDRRGVVVKVYTCPADFPVNRPASWTGSSTTDLYNYEMGYLGKYFY
ncbi:Nn.00g083410.m01.CDS01 [Neocucurbitaria sp. VM-36]